MKRTPLPSEDSPSEPTDASAEQYEGHCYVCGELSTFTRRHRSLREGFACPHCGATLRYRGQAEVLVGLIGLGPETCLQDFEETGALASLRIYEPGVSGPFRKLFAQSDEYVTSFFWDDVPPGTLRRGVPCQNLEQLTFDDDHFDIVITSDIMEHVRRPWRAFQEIQRVLKPGGVHVFSIPMQSPAPQESVMRVDTSGSQDVHIAEPHYHGDGKGGKSLVYIDYGWDLLPRLLQSGGEVRVHVPSDENAEARRLLTFVQRKPEASPAEQARCNICGGRRMVAGPLGRLSASGKLPTCADCGSLERHRILRRVWNALPRRFLEYARALQFSRDPSVEPDWFGAHEESIFGTDTSIDIQAIDREDGSYDVVICNHVLEHVEDDRIAFRELMRVLTDDGFLQLTVPSPISRSETEEWGYAREDFHGHYRHYGLDLIDRFQACVEDARMLYVRSRDAATGIEDYVFFWSRSEATLDRLRRALTGQVEVMS